MSDIPTFPMNPQHALKIIHETAKDSSKVTIPNPPNAGLWESVVTYRQVYRCLEMGEIVNGPQIDRQGNWSCMLARTSAGIHVLVTVSAIKDGEQWHLVVTRVQKA